MEDFHKVLASIEGHCGIFDVKESDLTTLQRLVIQYLARVSCFEEVRTEYSYWHKFSGFGQSKAMISRGLKSLCRFHRSKTDEDRELATFLLETLPMNPKWGYHATQLYKDICQAVAGSIVQKRLFEDIKAGGQSDEKEKRDDSSPAEPPSDAVFGSHNSASLDEIPF